MTYFKDGSTDPARKDQLVEQKRVVFDKTPPKVLAFRPSLSADGASGVEWDVADDYMDPKGIKLEFKWPEMSRFESIDRNVPFWTPRQSTLAIEATDRMQVRLTAIDRAGNKTVSDPVWVSGKDAIGGGPAPVPKGTASAASAVRDADASPAAGARAVQPTLHYVNNKTINLNVTASPVGRSGLTNALLWIADEKLVWKVAQELGEARSSGDISG